MSTPASLVSDKLSFEEYLAAYDGVRAEWVDGDVVTMSPAGDPHQDIVEFLVSLFRYFVEETGAGLVRSQHFPMKFGGRARVPDILFVAAEHMDRYRGTYIDGPADLAVEVVSPESRARDRNEKLSEYERAGVREYWLLDPISERAELYRLDDSGRYTLIPLGDPPRLRSEVMRGLWIDPAWLWSKPIPKLTVVYKEWGPL